MPLFFTMLLHRHLVKKHAITLSQAPLVNTSLHGTLSQNSDFHKTYLRLVNSSNLCLTSP